MVCWKDVPSNATLTTHLKDVHHLDLIPGCPQCPYHRQRMGDVEKHCKHQHNLEEASQQLGQSGLHWGLVE